MLGSVVIGSPMVLLAPEEARKVAGYLLEAADLRNADLRKRISDSR